MQVMQEEHFRIVAEPAKGASNVKSVFSVRLLAGSRA